MTKILGLIVAVTLLAGCGGGGGPPTAGGTIVGGNPGDGSGGGTDTPVTTLSMGSGSGGSFQAGQIEVSAGGSAMLSAGGSTTLRVAIVNQDGVLYTGESVDVTFNSQCIAQQLATVTEASSSTGIATTTYVAKGCSGPDLVTATATANNQLLTASVTLTVAAAAIGSIEFVSATPTTISLRGTGGPNRPETSTVIFSVKDTSGGARANAPVTFELVSTLGGGVTFEPATATSDVNGNVQTVVRSGTVATTVAIKATTVISPGNSIFSQSSNLSVSTGLTDGDSISLSVSCQNVEALSHDGEVVQVTVRMADRFNNPAADGTPANFRTEGGKIGASCLATTTDDESGVCSVNWVSQSPRPANGRSTILVSTTGEESFTDSNGNGLYDDNDSGFADRGEPFLDEDENGTREMTEPFVDFNGNGMYDDVDGQFNGVLCQHSTNCSTQQSTSVSDEGVIVLSGSNAVITPASGNLPFGSLSFLITDVNNNQMPGGTVVKLEVQDAKVVGPSQFTWPCSAAVGGGTFTFNVIPDGTNPSGRATLTVTTPKGLVSLGSYTVGP